MSKQPIFKILLPRRDRNLHEKLFRLLPMMIDTEIPATYGYFYLQTIFFDKRNVIKNMKHYEELLGKDVNRLRESCKETLLDEMLMSWEIWEASGLTQQDLTRILLSTGQEVLPSCARAHGSRRRILTFTYPIVS